MLKKWGLFWKILKIRSPIGTFWVGRTPKKDIPPLSCKLFLAKMGCFCLVSPYLSFVWNYGTLGSRIRMKTMCIPIRVIIYYISIYPILYIILVILIILYNIASFWIIFWIIRWTHCWRCTNGYVWEVKNRDNLRGTHNGSVAAAVSETIPTVSPSSCTSYNWDSCFLYPYNLSSYGN